MPDLDRFFFLVIAGLLSTTSPQQRPQLSGYICHTVGRKLHLISFLWYRNLLFWYVLTHVNVVIVGGQCK
jgi:hypothetical protein